MARSTPLFYYNKELFDGRWPAGRPGDLGRSGRCRAGAGDQGWRHHHPRRLRAPEQRVLHRLALPAGRLAEPWRLLRSGVQHPDQPGRRRQGRQLLSRFGAERLGHHAGRSESRFRQRLYRFDDGVHRRPCAASLQDATFEVGTAFLPKAEAFGCCTGGAGLAILANKSAEQQEAAFQFVKWATEPEQTAWWSQNTGYMPVRKSAVDEHAGLLRRESRTSRPRSISLP